MNMKSNQDTNRYGCAWCIIFTTKPRPFRPLAPCIFPSGRMAFEFFQGILRWPEPQRKSIHLENCWRQLGGLWVFCRCGLLKLHFARERCGHHHFDHVFCRKPTGKKNQNPSESIFPQLFSPSSRSAKARPWHTRDPQRVELPGPPLGCNSHPHCPSTWRGFPGWMTWMIIES